METHDVLKFLRLFLFKLFYDEIFYWFLYFLLKFKSNVFKCFIVVHFCFWIYKIENMLVQIIGVFLSLGNNEAWFFQRTLLEQIFEMVFAFNCCDFWFKIIVNIVNLMIVEISSKHEMIDLWSNITTNLTKVTKTTNDGNI